MVVALEAGRAGAALKREKLTYWLSLSRSTGEKGNKKAGASAPAPKTNSSNRRWAEEELDRVEEKGLGLITRDSPEYPPSLLNTADPPHLLYAKGLLEKGGAWEKDYWAAPAVAIVGTRRPTHFGLAMAERLGSDLARLGVTVVSGMARGCDSAAHKGALKAGGRTIAVLGTGVDVIYPPENGRLYDEIGERGLILSELPLGSPPLPYHFPLRNRIISGLSLGVVVVEAPHKSGAMMTARLALDDGREVMAVPGKAGLTKSAGTNRLIKDGAALVESAGDVIETLGLEVLGLEALGPEVVKVNGEEGGAGAGLKKGEAEIMGLFELQGDDPMQIDEIAEKAGVPVHEASAMLLALELKGLVEQKPGKLFFKRFV